MLAADLVGFSNHAETDEEATLSNIDASKKIQKLSIKIRVKVSSSRIKLVKCDPGHLHPVKW